MRGTLEIDQLIAGGLDRIGDSAHTLILIASDRARLDGLGSIPPRVQTWVSPALQRLIDTDPSLSTRLPAPVTGIVGDEALIEPGEFLSISNLDSVTVLGTDGALVLPRHQPEGNEGLRVDGAVLGLLIAGIILVSLPVATFLTAATRFGAERRSSRLTALALAGATTRQLRGMMLVETLTGTGLGFALGWALFLAARPAMASIRVGSHAAFSTDLVPHPALLALTGVAVVGVAVLAAFSGTTQAAFSPLESGAHVGGRQGRRAWIGFLVVFAGLAGLAIGVASPTDTDAPTRRRSSERLLLASALS